MLSRCGAHYTHARDDGKTLVVMGDSMGGQQSFATVGLVGAKLKVTALIAHVPSGSDVGARSKGRSMAYPNWPGRPEVIETARYFDTANFAPRVKCASLVSFGLFTVVINALILWLVADLSGIVAISGLWSLLWATFIVSLVHVVLDHLLHS